MTRRNARIQGWVFSLFSPDSDDRLSLNFHRFVILYRSCDTRSVSLEQYCSKGSNGFKPSSNLLRLRMWSEFWLLSQRMFCWFHKSRICDVKICIAFAGRLHPVFNGCCSFSLYLYSAVNVDQGCILDSFIPQKGHPWPPALDSTPV